MEKNIFNTEVESNINSVKNIAEVAKTVAGANDFSTFKVVNKNLPTKTSFWTSFKNVLFSEIKVELTPYEQKIEDEINEFLHKEITWKSFKSFWLQEIKF